MGAAYSTCGRSIDLYAFSQISLVALVSGPWGNGLPVGGGEHSPGKCIHLTALLFFSLPTFTIFGSV